MNDQFQWWLLILGIGIGAAVTWLLIGTIPRREEDVAADERAAEAQWISATIAADGGVAPPPLVEEIITLHRQYLAGPPVELPDEPPAPRPAHVPPHAATAAERAPDSSAADAEHARGSTPSAAGGMAALPRRASPPSSSGDPTRSERAVD